MRGDRPEHLMRACRPVNGRAVYSRLTQSLGTDLEEQRYMAYSVGDTVIYPHHGAAVIERKEERELKGEAREYLVLRLTYGDLTLMVPADSCEEVGIRNVVSQKEVEQVLDVLREPEGKAAGNWSRRFKANYEKLRSGDIYQVAEVVRNLATREKDKGLSA